MTTVTLSNQASFTKFFKQFVAGEITDAVTIKFKLPESAKKIPFLLVQGEGYNGTIDSLVRNALQTHQTNINRLYSLVTYGKVTKLKASEVESLRIIFQVNEGSSTLIIKNIKEILDFIIPAVVNRNTAAALAVGLLITFTDFGLNNYRDNKNMIFTAEQNQLDRDHTTEENQLDRDHATEENQRDRDARERELQIIKEINGCQQIIDGGEEFLERLTKLSRNADVVEHSGHTVSRSPEKIDKEFFQDQLNGMYKILQFDKETDGYFKIKVENVTTGDKFNAKLSADIRQHNMRPIISGAVHSGTVLNLNIDAFLVDNKIYSALIVSIVE